MPLNPNVNQQYFDFTGGTLDLDNDGNTIDSDIDDQWLLTNICKGDWTYGHNVHELADYSHPNYRCGKGEFTYVNGQVTLDDFIQGNQIPSPHTTHYQWLDTISSGWWIIDQGNILYDPWPLVPSDNWLTDGNGQEYLFIDGICYRPDAQACQAEQIVHFGNTYTIPPTTYQTLSLGIAFVIMFVLLKRIAFK